MRNTDVRAHMITNLWWRGFDLLFTLDFSSSLRFQSLRRIYGVFVCVCAFMSIENHQMMAQCFNDISYSLFKCVCVQQYKLLATKQKQK